MIPITEKKNILDLIRQKNILKNNLCWVIFYLGRSSGPPLAHGWHRKIRQIDIIPPFITPNRQMAW